MSETRIFEPIVKQKPNAQLSVHYYVLSICGQTGRLYEGFRDRLIDIQNTDFPYTASSDDRESATPDSQKIHLRKFLRRTDRLFARYFNQDPLRLVLVGEGKNLSLFKSMTVHQKFLIGEVEGDFASTSPRDLGKIVWPVVKEVMAGASEKAMRDLDKAADARKVLCGLDALGQSAGFGRGAILFVEEDYHVKGGIDKSHNSMVLPGDVDILEVIDDAVDVIIEKVLEKGGNVVFLDNGSLIKFQRIALMRD